MGSWRGSRCFVRGQRVVSEGRSSQPFGICEWKNQAALFLQNRKSTEIVKRLWIRTLGRYIFWMFCWGICSVHCVPEGMLLVHLHGRRYAWNFMMLNKHLTHFCFHFWHPYVWLFHIDMEKQDVFPLTLSPLEQKDLIGLGFNMDPISKTTPPNFCFLHLHNMCFHLGLPCQYVSHFFYKTSDKANQLNLKSVLACVCVCLYACVCLEALFSSGFGTCGERSQSLVGWDWPSKAQEMLRGL